MWLWWWIPTYERNYNSADTSAAAVPANNANTKEIFKNYAPFIDCISKINNTDVDNAKLVDVVMPMYNLIEGSGNYSKHLEVYVNIIGINLI